MDSMEASDFNGMRAAQYVRMSTELQKYSIENQKDVIRQYAEKHGIEIVRTYADEGKSGLSFERRPALKCLIDDVLNGEPDFSMILVLDVSRWGRFQDIDEGAYYEFLCRKAGMRVEYCAEAFENDGSSISAILKSLKRTMASEFSRELSVKVFNAKRQLASRGYWAGSRPPYGLRRMLLDASGKPKLILRNGERKSLSTERVVLVLGPRKEIDVIRWIFRAYLAGINPSEIGRQLGARGVTGRTGRPWRNGRVLKTLKNETYTGTAVWNRDRCGLRRERKRNKQEDWVKVQGAFEPVISRELFDQVQAKLAKRSIPYDRDMMLKGLRRLQDERGYLSWKLVNEDKRIPSGETYRTSFGSLSRAYQLIGYVPGSGPDRLALDIRLLDLRQRFLDDLTHRIESSGGHLSFYPKKRRFIINEETCIAVRFLRCFLGRNGKPVWRFWFKHGWVPDVAIAARMDESNTQIQDYFLIPKRLLNRRSTSLCKTNKPAIEACRYESLDPIVSALTRGGIREKSNEASH